MLSIIIIVIVILIYFSYTFYKYWNNNKIEKTIKKNEIKNSIISENFKNEKKITKEPNLIIQIKYKDEVYKFEIMLYDHVVPLTCKNFRYIAKKGLNNVTYNKSIFHRVIPGFMIQGGDIIYGNGTGSKSIFGDNFEDENFNLNHDKPGLLSMANSGPNSNGCQFFITTVDTPHLNGKHVVFGEIISNLELLYKLENVETDENDKPINPITIESIEEK